MGLLPQINNTDINNVTKTILPSKTYKINQNIVTRKTVGGEIVYTEDDRIMGFIDNIEAVKQAILHILMTERYAYIIYDDNYGIEFEQYIGADIDFINATIENTLKEALTYDLRITDVKVNNLQKINNDTVAVIFTAYTVYGDLTLEVNINV